MADQLTEVVVHARSDTFVLIGASMVFLLACLGIAIVGRLEGMPAPLLVIPTYVGVPFFGLCFVLALRRLGRPLIRIGPDGIVDHTTIAGPGLIRWEEIQSIRRFDRYGQRYLGLDLRDPQLVLSRQPRVRRLGMRLNAWLLGVDVSIPETALPRTVDELLAAVARVAPAGQISFDQRIE